jgi:hypothetical protein
LKGRSKSKIYGIREDPRERVKRLVYRKFGISEMDISEIDTFDDVISDTSISDISIAKNGHIGLDISEI